MRDPYVASVKGAIYRMASDVLIVDITHQAPLFNLNQTSYILKNSFPSFPEGSVHIIGTESEASIDTPHMAVQYKGHFFIGADNGIFSLMFESKPEKIVEIEIPQDSDYFTFPSRDVFAKAAVHLAQGNPIESLGIKRDQLYRMVPFQPIILEGLISGKVIYVDNFENAITNISETFFHEHVRSKAFTISFLSQRYRISEISRSYRDVSNGQMLALFNTAGMLEIAVNGGNAESLLGLKVEEQVRIEF